MAGERFAGRCDGDAVYPLLRTLGGGIKAALALDLVAKEFDAHGQGVGRREDVEDAAPVAELTGGLDDADRFVAQPRPQVQYPLQVERLAHVELAYGGAELAQRQRALHQRAGRGDDHPLLPSPYVGGGKGGENFQAARDDFVGPGGALVKEGQWLGEAQDALWGGRPIAQGVGQSLGALYRAGDDQHRALQIAGQRGQEGWAGSTQEAQRSQHLAPRQVLPQGAIGLEQFE